MGSRVFVEAASGIRIDRHFDKGYEELALEAVRQLEKGGIEVRPEALVISSMASESVGEQLSIAGVVADYLGLRGVKTFRVEAGEASGLAALQASFYMVSSGFSRSVLVLGVEKASDLNVSAATKVYSMIGDLEYVGIRGMAPHSEAAILAKIYMERYRYSYEDLFRWPVTMHRNASRNRHAQLRFAIKEDSYKDSPIVSEPLRLLDTYPIGDGAAAVYISSRPGSAGIEIAGIGSSNDLHDAASREDPLFFRAVRESFDEALRMAGVARNELAQVEIHDSFTPYAHIVLESMGLVERGEAPRKLSQDSSIDGVYINIGGGLKARGHPWGATGIYQTYEIFLSLTGGWDLLPRAGKVGAVQAMNGPGSQSYVVVMKRVG